MELKQTTREISKHGSPSLAERLSVDAITALVAATTVTPIMTVIDRAVTEAAAGHKQLFQSIRISLKIMATVPHRFLTGKPFGVMFLLYSGTYLTANSVDTFHSITHEQAASTTSSTATKLAAVTGVNMCLSIYKDSHFARTFGIGPSRSLRAACYPIFILRDSITLFASFNLPQMVAPKCPESLDQCIDRNLAMQLAIPALSQFVVSPLHLLGLDLYNRSGKVPSRDRMRLIAKAYPSTSLARTFRVFPAYGLGGVVNTNVRTRLMERLESKRG